MVLFVQPKLANDAFGDAGLLLDFSFGGRAILFDLGDLSRLPGRTLFRVRHVFVSHMHMDHFVGFDKLLRLFLRRIARVHIFGPPGLTDAVEAKLRAYTWNLLDETSEDFSIVAADWNLNDNTVRSQFRARNRFLREPLGIEVMPRGLLLVEPDFQIEAVELDHGIPCLAFAFQESLRVNVHKARLDQLGLPVGPWLTEAKRLVRAEADPSVMVTVKENHAVQLKDLLSAEVLVTGPGERVVYATDLAFSKVNVDKLLVLARGADYLFIEGGFLEEDKAIAASKRHLTAFQAGTIAAAARVSRAVPMHFSPRYLGREQSVIEEFQTALTTGSLPSWP
ncbi:MBL fold metallo-hydrolase [Sinorhizobium numidicum]|uniref:MBL fold metallo-hydrolase n=1 Tax=Sinorhizobium numidicum TaxID=680248 RepID=A0ABY8CTD3_9HYPH|nr:MBL fold metallo-hydrolase [Sinorhizobium numidicum]WEX74478.1 MBL fold metallo-hydrolase [Sinorhizobium numidicum]WEX80468.1 MBL fold metallo-hydrolase [Sinorhizobium numidicum]